VQRNFQGYTVDPADALLGLGASAIGRLPHGYVQNDPAIPAYRRAVEGGRLPTVRGVAFSPEDVVRGDAIERLMCDLRFSARGMRDRHGPAAEATIEIARDIVSEDAFGLVEPDADGFAVTERGRPFVRTIAAAFDAYLPRGVATHSSAV
jgi:oxygen-independent coproporphyrinogen-3 oxidase